MAFITWTIMPLLEAAPFCNKCQEEIGETLLQDYSVASDWMQSDSLDKGHGWKDSTTQSNSFLHTLITLVLGGASPNTSWLNHRVKLLT